jgi:hypothetical protein
MPAAEDDRQLPLVPLKYAGGARQQCDGSTTLTVGPLMLDGETRDRGAAGPRRQSRPSAGAAVSGSPEGHGVATTVSLYPWRSCGVRNVELNMSAPTAKNGSRGVVM